MSDHSNTCKRRGDCQRATSRLLTVVLILACGWLAACSPPPLLPQVRPREPLSATDLRYGISSHMRVHYHALPNPDKLEISQGLRIPPSQRRRNVSVEASGARAVSLALPEPRPPLRPRLPDRDWSRGSPLFAWPVDGEVTSRFGPRHGRFHDGIDIAAPQGTPVFAAAEGQVIFSDVLRGYGKVVIVRHAGGYLTLYAHNAANQVQEGQSVRRGTRVATVGQSGHVTGANLHFEVRKDNRARDPLRYLPPETRTVLRDPSSR
jgi:lipoprotein NlpD